MVGCGVAAMAVAVAAGAVAIVAAAVVACGAPFTAASGGDGGVASDAAGDGGGSCLGTMLDGEASGPGNADGIRSSYGDPCTKSPKPLFCDDFDQERMLGPPWTPPSPACAMRMIDPTNPVSSPNTLLSTPGESGCPEATFPMVQIGAVPPFLRGFTCELDFRAADAPQGNLRFFSLTGYDVAKSPTMSFWLVLDAPRGQVDITIDTGNDPSGGQQTSVGTVAVATDWHHLEMRIYQADGDGGNLADNYSSTLTEISFAVDARLGQDPPPTVTLAVPKASDAYTLGVGVPRDACGQVRYDNVACSEF